MNDQNNPQSDQTVEIPPETRAFLESLLEDTHMQFLDDEQKEGMLSQLYAKLDYYLTARIVEALPEDSLDEFTRMNEEGKTREEVEAFIMEKIPDAQELFKDAFIEFRDLYVGAGQDQDTNAPEASQPMPSAPAETMPASSAMPSEAAQPVSFSTSEPVTTPDSGMNASMPEDVPPPPPAPVPSQSEDENNNGSSPMTN